MGGCDFAGGAVKASPVLNGVKDAKGEVRVEGGVIEVETVEGCDEARGVGLVGDADRKNIVLVRMVCVVDAEDGDVFLGDAVSYGHDIGKCNRQDGASLATEPTASTQVVR